MGMKEIIRELEAGGFRVGQEKRQHHQRVYDPAGKVVFIFSCTPSCHRGWLNSIAGLRRATGLPLGRKEKR